MNEITILKVERGTLLARRLICFVEGFSWEDVKAHMLSELKAWSFHGWEAPFAAAAGGKIVGVAFLRRSDYYPLPEIYPWVTGIFVAEEYRGRGICGMLIAAANEYALKIGFKRTYIPSIHTGLYEKYGYRYVGSIKNYAGEADKLYAKDI